MKKNPFHTQKGVSLWNRAKELIPGGSQLLSKRSEMFLPDFWPSYYQKAKGVTLWDLDGNRYIDMSIMGIGTCILGYADQEVNRAVKKAIDAGVSTTLNPPEEVELAEKLCALHTWAQMARFARTGGEAMAIAVRIARAHAQKDGIAFCGYHGWSDWYLAANLADDKNLDGHLLHGLAPAGVPRGLNKTVFPFYYNKIDELETLIREHKNIGTVVMEPFRKEEPKDNFLQKVKKIAKENNLVLVFDEITSAFRKNLGGVHLTYGVNPDIAVFGKTLSNGFAMSAIIGTKKVMQSAQKTFISSTYWTERIGPVAALATITKIERENVIEHVARTGASLKSSLNEIFSKHALKIRATGPNAVISLNFDYGGNSAAVKTFFTQEMLRGGFLSSTPMFITYAHKPAHIRSFLKAVDIVCAAIHQAIKNKSIRARLLGPVAHSGFKRLT